MQDPRVHRQVVDIANRLLCIMRRINFHSSDEVYVGALNTICYVEDIHIMLDTFIKYYDLSERQKQKENLELYIHDITHGTR